MDAPVYKLEHVVHSREGMEDFEGPLDLILYLLVKNRIEIQDIPIALILEQYLAYLELRQQMDLEVASEFITMAAQLMFIKTRMLLSLEDEEAQSEMEELIRSLEERRSSENYTKIKYVTGLLGPMGEFGRRIFVRTPEPMERGAGVPLQPHPRRPVGRLQRGHGAQRAAAAASGEQLPGHCTPGALPRGGEGPGGVPAAVPGDHQLPPPVSRQPQPQRDRSDLPGGAGAVPG